MRRRGAGQVMKGVYIPVHDRLNEGCNKVSTKKDESQFISSVAFALSYDTVQLARLNRKAKEVVSTKGGSRICNPLCMDLINNQILLTPSFLRLVRRLAIERGSLHTGK